MRPLEIIRERPLLGKFFAQEKKEITGNRISALWIAPAEEGKEGHWYVELFVNGNIIKHWRAKKFYIHDVGEIYRTIAENPLAPALSFEVRGARFRFIGGSETEEEFLGDKIWDYISFDVMGKEYF